MADQREATTVVKVSKAIHRRARIRAAELGTSIKEFTEAAIRDKLARRRAQAGTAAE